MKAFSSLALAAVVATAALPASAQFAKSEDAIKYRQSALSVLGTHFSRLGAMANGKIPFDAKSAQESAEVAAFMSKLPWAGFGADIRGSRGQRSGVRPLCGLRAGLNIDERRAGCRPSRGQRRHAPQAHRRAVMVGLDARA